MRTSSTRPRRWTRALILAACACGAGVAAADPCASLLTSTNLTTEQIRGLWTARAASRETQWRAFTKVVRGKRKTVVLLGERADALATDTAAARPVIDLFERIGTPSGSSNHEPTTPYASEFLAGVLMMPAFAIRKLFSRKRGEPPSRCAMGSARCRFVQNLERLHRPRWTEEANLLGFGAMDLASTLLALPALYFGINLATGVVAAGPAFAWTAGTALALRGIMAVAGRFTSRWPIVRNRDVSIAKHLDEEIASTRRGAYLGIVGRAHVPNLAAMLTTEYGFEEVDLSEPAPAP